MTDTFIRNIHAIQPSTPSASVYLQARKCFVDYLSCLIGAQALTPAVEMNSTLSPSAMKMGYAAHLLEMDDGHRWGAVHVGATVFSALLAMAEQEHISSEDFLFGAIIGYEATIRLACAIQPGNKLRGYHATGTCGTIGAALGIAAALHYSEEQMRTTLSAAVTSAAGVLEMQEDDSDLKPYNVGRAAMDAVVASYVGRTKLKGPKDALGGKRGFLKVMTDQPKTSFLTDFNSETFCIEQIYQKVYAACRHAHPSIQAALTLRDHILLKDVKSIQIRAYKLAVAGHDHTEIKSVSSAKMSIPFSVAVALVTGSAGIEGYTEDNITNKEILSLAKKVKVVEDEYLTSLAPAKRASILVIETTEGTFRQQIDYPKGEPENPLTREELEGKFQHLCAFGGLQPKYSNELSCELLEKEFDLAEILNIIHRL